MTQPQNALTATLQFNRNRQIAKFEPIQNSKLGDSVASFPIHTIGPMTFIHSALEIGAHFKNIFNFLIGRFFLFRFVNSPHIEI